MGDVSPDESKSTWKKPEFEWLDKEALGTGTDYKDLSVINQLSRAFLNVINVPLSISRNRPSANASIQFSREDSGWRIQRLKGDEYIRVILYDAFYLIEKDPSWDELDRKKIQRVSLNLALSAPLPTPGTDIQIQGHKITILIHPPEEGVRYPIVTSERKADGRETYSLDLLGLFFGIKEAIKDPNAIPDELQHLRTHPAFIRPIDR